MKNQCSVCGNETKLLSRFKLSDGVICGGCITRAVQYNKALVANIKSMSTQGIKQAIQRSEDNVSRLESFTPTKKIGKFIYFDIPKKQWLVPTGMFGDTKKSLVRDFSEIQEYELLENGGTVSSGGLGRAVVGGVLFGGVGAVVGGVTGKKKGKSTVSSIQIKITTKDIESPVVTIDIYKGGDIKTNSFIYKNFDKQAQEILSILSIITKELSNRIGVSTTTQPSGLANELRELKKLVDEGILTNEEFEKKKKDMIG